ncbi:MAG: hypothetical protein AUH85_07240 [Chloroflexi bacterium 13_1_40CM_4_68_4]|nr:MAG: hypothetical protein AUH85_07240 [Chloroflexi bacterium 13_1_40CM_4_68_4]
MSSDPIRGKTVRWTYEDGPMAGKQFEHRFGADGTVRYREIGDHRQEQRQSGNGSTTGPGAKYELARVNDDVYAVSYLSSSGFTLTTVIDTKNDTIVSFASNEKELVVQHGTFEPASRVT